MIIIKVFKVFFIKNLLINFRFNINYWISVRIIDWYSVQNLLERNIKIIFWNQSNDIFPNSMQIQNIIIEKNQKNTSWNTNNIQISLHLHFVRYKNRIRNQIAQTIYQRPTQSNFHHIIINFIWNRIWKNTSSQQ